MYIPELIKFETNTILISTIPDFTLSSFINTYNTLCKVDFIESYPSENLNAIKRNLYFLIKSKKIQ